LYLKFDKLLRALANYVPWVATIKTQVVCPSAKFLGFVKGLNLAASICIEAGPKKAGRATGVV
jgi:hypothetical protein